MMRKLLPTLLVLLTLMFPHSASAKAPNIVLIVADNLGYGDLGCYGSTQHRTPHLDQMAENGLQLTSFYVSSGVCTPSRASMMTGCYPVRISMHESDLGHLVLQPVSPKGLHSDEVTVAEVLKTAGYDTTIIGKWHLGDQPEFLPTRQGFDSFFGIPYSDDMTPRAGKPWPPLPLMEDERVIESGVDRNLLTKRYTARAVQFIEAHSPEKNPAAAPFFLYMPQAMPGSTQTPYASDAFRGKSANGSYGDSVEELDWSLGEVTAALRRSELDRETLVIWTSDNGAPRRNPPQGSNLPLKGYGYDTSEGAMRVPCLIQWTGTIQAARTCDTLCSTLDLLPTLSGLAGAKMDTDRIIDGRDIWPVISGMQTASPHEAFFYYFKDQLQAVRSGPWKLYLPWGENSLNTRAHAPTVPELYNVVSDLSETHNLAEQQPETVQKLLQFAAQAREQLGDHNHPSPDQRPAGFVKSVTPRVP